MRGEGGGRGENCPGVVDCAEGGVKGRMSGKDVGNGGGKGGLDCSGGS